MIKSLQKRFVVTAMLAVAILLAVLIGTINIANLVLTEQHTDSLLDFLLRAESIERKEHPPRFNNQFASPPFNEDTRMSSVHFTAVVGEDVNVDVRRIATVDEKLALEYVEKAIASGKSEGKVERFKFRVTERGGKLVYVFLDASAQTYSMWRIAILLVFCGAVAFVLMLLLVILLSKRAIQPIALNIERQKQFVTDAGHELKTPVAIILANTEAMELHTGTTKWSVNIREQALRLTSLTQNMLSLARADETHKKNVTEFLLDEVLLETVDMFREPFARRGLVLDADIEQGVKIKADKDAASRVLSILFDNVQSYADENSTVSISLHKNKFSICNECESLPDVPPEKLFDRFYRGDSSRNSRGYGIGLSAAYALLSGKIKAEYIDGKKIRFIVDFT